MAKDFQPVVNGLQMIQRRLILQRQLPLRLCFKEQRQIVFCHLAKIVIQHDFKRQVVENIAPGIGHN